MNTPYGCLEAKEHTVLTYIHIEEEEQSQEAAMGMR